MLNMRSEAFCSCSHKEKEHGMENEECYKVLQMFPELIWCGCRKFILIEKKKIQ